MVVDGIEVSLTADQLDDFEIMEAIADTADESATDAARLAAVVRLYRLTFGDDYRRVKRELREMNGGRLTNETMQAFYSACLEVAKAKN